MWSERVGMQATEKKQSFGVTLLLLVLATVSYSSLFASNQEPAQEAKVGDWVKFRVPGGQTSGAAKIVMVQRKESSFNIPIHTPVEPAGCHWKKVPGN